MSRARLRQIVLAGTGALFLVIAIVALVAPRVVARSYALPLPDASALNEFRAVFTGFWVGLFVLFTTASRHPEDVRLGDVCAILVLCQALARVVSVVLDGLPAWSFVGAMVGELACAVVILALRPRRPAG